MCYTTHIMPGVKSAQHETATNNSPLLSSQLIDTATVLSKM